VQTDISYRLVLASASPARRALLKAAGIDADVLVSGIDESIVEADDAYTLSLALARMKARTVAARMQADPGVRV
jgi:septum formation protein